MAKIIGIGALGGSGTRAVAKVLMECDVHIGYELNGPLDNKVFAGLFRTPNWFDIHDKEEIHKRVRIFREYMENDALSPSSIIQLYKANKSAKNFPWQFYLKALFRKKKKRRVWGWKEPNTHHYLEELSRTFNDDLKYVHVIRHGLDMAYSTNRSQLKNWGHLYGIPLTGRESEDEMRVKQLDFWIQTTHEIIQKMESSDIDCYLLRHNEFCEKPEKEIRALLEFAGLQVDEEKVLQCSKIPEIPKTQGRYREHDLTIFRKDQLEKVRDFGFEIQQGA